MLLHDSLDAACGQADEIKPESRIDRIGQRAEPLTKQALHDADARHRQTCLDGNGAYRAVGAKESGLQSPGALALPLHHADEFLRQPRQRRSDCIFGRDRLRKMFFHHEVRWHPARTDRGIALPEHFAQQIGECLTEPRGDLAWFTGGNIADGIQSRTA